MFDPRPLVDIAVAIGREAGALVQRMRAEAVVVVRHEEHLDRRRHGGRPCLRTTRTDASVRVCGPANPCSEKRKAARFPATDGLSWVVDPIDGTVNYLYGIPWYSVSIAAQLDGVSVAGAVVEPATGRVWTAARGCGAFLDGTPLRVSATTDLSLSLLGYGFAYRPERRQRQADTWAAMATRVRDLRRAGAASLDLCSVAAGRLDAYAEHALGRWDWAAGALVAAEAGAVVRLPGTAPELGADATFAAAPGIADAMYAALAESGFGKV